MKDIAHVRWMTEVGRAFGGRAAVVRHDEEHPWNTCGYACVDLASIEGHNVVFWCAEEQGTYIAIARPRDEIGI